MAESQRIELCRLLRHPSFQDLFLTIRVLSIWCPWSDSNRHWMDFKSIISACWITRTHWWGEKDLNLRRLALQANALPTELSPHMAEEVGLEPTRLLHPSTLAVCPLHQLEYSSIHIYNIIYLMERYAGIEPAT